MKKYSTQEVKAALTQARELKVHVEFKGDYVSVFYSPTDDIFYWSYSCGDEDCGCFDARQSKNLKTFWFADDEYVKEGA